MKTCIGIRVEKFSVFHLNSLKETSDEKVHKIINIGKQNDYVYDIETETHELNCCVPLIVQDTDRFVLSVNTKDLIKDSKNLEIIFDFNNLNKKHEKFNKKNKEVIGRLKMKLLVKFGLMNLID